MLAINESIMIERSPEEVFAFISNFENDPQWRSGLLRITQTPAAPTQIGTIAEETSHFMGREINTSAVVTQVIDSQLIVFKSFEGPYPMRGQRSTERADGRSTGRTRFAFTVIFELNGMVALASPLVTAVYRRQMQGDLFRLKHLLERQSAQRGRAV